MPDPKKPWEKNYTEDIVETKIESKKPWEQDYDVAEGEKKKSTSTTTPQKLDSETTTGSSGGVNPAFKSTIPSPIPDFNSIPKSKEKPKKEASFYEYLKENLDTGLATVSKSIYDAPGLVYDVAASITNPVFKAMGVDEDKLASSDKLANDLGFKNIPSEILKEKIKVSNEKINEYSIKNGGDAWKAVTDGNYVGAAKLVAGTTMQSLPIMVAAMASGGQTSALTAIGISTASTKNAQLKEENPEMGLGTRVLNSANAGIIEAVTGHLFTGASGAVMKKILADKGVDAGSKIIAKSFRSTVEKSIEKNPLISAVGEVVEESAVEFGNQLNDMSSGIRTEFDVHAIKNAGLSATGMGGLQTLGVYGAKGYVKAKTYAKVKATNKEVFKLRSEIDNGNLSPENKAILSLRADRLEAENKKLLGTEIEKVKALPTEAKTELNALNQEFDDLKTKFDDIDDADDIPENLKPAMKEEIRLQASKNQKRKTEILSQNDGLEIDNDFSKFEGVEPDFDLENGKISSLPLKEQDRLNDQALQELTGGDMSIEVTKEQVSQKANEIYANEQTPEAQPQAEVQKPSEAEKVETPKPQEVSPVEDVVAPSVEESINNLNEIKNPDGSVETEYVFSNKPIKEDRPFMFVGKNFDVDFESENIKIEDIIPTQPTMSSGNIKRYINDSEKVESTEIYKINGKYFVRDGHHRIASDILKGKKDIEAKVKDFDKALLNNNISNEQYQQLLKATEEKAVKPKNEATPPTNTPADGNFPIGADNVGEVRATEQEIPAKESVPSSVDGGEVKGDASVGEIDATIMALKDVIPENESFAFAINTLPIAGTINYKDIKQSDYALPFDRYVNSPEKIDKDVASAYKIYEFLKNGGKLPNNVILLDKNGKILDGNNRVKAQLAVGVTDFKYAVADDKLFKQSNYKTISEAYHKAKKDGTNPELVKAVEDAIGKPAETPQPKSKGDVEVGKKPVSLPNLDDIADFINQTYLNDGKQEAEPTAESNKGTSENSVQENPSASKGAKGNKQKEIKLDKNGYVIVSKKGKTPLNQRKFKGDRKEAVNIEPTDAYSLVLSYFAKGGKIASAYFTSKGELQARNNNFNGIATKNAEGIDALAHTLWQSSENKTLKLDTGQIKDAIEDVVNSHNNVTDVVATLLKNHGLKEQEFPQEVIDYHQAIEEAQKEEKATDEEAQEVFSSIDQLSELEIIELAESQEKSYAEFLKDLEKRQVTYDLGSFSEQGTIQSDGWILSQNGELLSPESVSNVKQVNPEPEVKEKPKPQAKPEAKKPISKDTPELKEVNDKLEKANEKLRIAKEALDRKAKSLDKELVKDNEDIFGERKNQNENKLFDERVDGNARNKATEKERKAITDAQNEIKSLKETKVKIESGKITPTSEMDFDAKQKVDAVAENEVKVVFPKELAVFGINENTTVEQLKKIYVEAGEKVKEHYTKIQKALQEGKDTSKAREGYEKIHNEHIKFDDFVRKNSIHWYENYENKTVGDILGIEKKSESQQLKEKVNNEVDRIAQQVKDLLPGIKDPDLKKQGFSQDQLIDLIASAVKNLVSAGIDVNDAIKQVVDSIKAKFGNIDIDIKAVEERVKPKGATFESKPGKKSVLNRAFEGGNSDAITAAIEENGLDYRIENQEEAKQRAEDFVNQVGSAVALEAVRNNQIKGAEKAFVYSTIIDNLLAEIEGTSDLTERGKLEEEHAKIIADITNELSQEGTDAGRFISALNKVYNSSKLRYNLKSQIDAHKASNNGEISDEVLEKFTQADKRIKELEKLIEEAEAKVKKAEEEASIKNIQEDIERKKQLANKNKSGLTPREQTRKKELSNKFFGRFNDASGVITALADPEFREYLGLTFKQAKGDIDNFTKRVLAELGKGVQKHIPQLFEEGKKSTPANSKSITVGKSGKLSIPAQLFRDYVEAGETDIDVIAAKIKEDIADEFPDADVRDIRDALTGYGKQINPTKDEVSIEISRLKRLGKLISAYEDASNGINPLKSGLKQPKPTQEMRDLKKEINRLIKENGLDAVDLEKQWASALDKVKSQLKNQIEDLDKQIANGEKRKIERTTITLDDEATTLKAVRDAKKKLLDDMVGKPELTEEQLIARAEKSLQTSIDKLQKDIADGQIEYKEKPSVKQSKKLEELRKQRKELVEAKNQMREEAGLVEAQRLKSAKKRVKNQIEDLQQKITDKDFSKKEPKPLIEDTELSQLRAEKLLQQEIYDAQKYADELKNRSKFQRWSDAFIELWNVPRILKATGELSTVLIQGGILTTSRKLTNPKALGKIMKQLLISLGSAKSAAKYEALIKASPEYALAVKSKLALTNPDYKSDVREEQYSGDYANLFWDLPFVLASYNSRASKAINKERTVFGDVLKKATGIGTPGTGKLSIRQQWKNVNPFVVLERGGTLYMNTLRMEEFVRGVEMLRMEGKNEVDHLQDFKLLANAINTMSGRANLPATVATSSKLLAAVFFSARNAVSIVNQVNPIYYGYLHFGSTDGAQIKKTSVANKLAVTNMVRFITITGLTMLAIKVAAGKDEDDEDVVQIETDPNSSDFMKMRIGDIRFDPWHGMTTMIVLMSRLITENVKSTSDGKTTKLGEKRFGPQSRLDLIGAWGRNKFAPSMAITANYLDTHEEIDPETGDEFRQTPFGKKFIDDESLDLTPMYWSAVKEIQAEDPGVMAEFLTVASVFGWNTSVYKAAEPKDKFKDSQTKIKAYNDLPKSEKEKVDANNRVVSLRQKLAEIENYKRAKLTNTPYLVKGAEKPADLSNFNVDMADEAIGKLKAKIEEYKTKAGDEYKAPKE